MKKAQQKMIKGCSSNRLFFHVIKRQISNLNTFFHKDIEITLSEDSVAKPDWSKPFGFGVHRTNYMLEIDHNHERGWGKPVISPWHNLSIDPRNQTLHYAVEVFEGMKAYRNNEKLYLFRPDLNMARMNRSASRVCLPNFDGEELIKCIIDLVKLEESFIHNKIGYSLYIRPTFISMTDTLGVFPPINSKLYVICSPSGPYFATGMKPIDLVCNDEDYVRAFRGGFGSYKLGANYGPTLQKYVTAVKEGYSHILWLTNGL